MGEKHRSTYASYELGRVFPPLDVVQAWAERTQAPTLVATYWESLDESPGETPPLASVKSVETYLEVATDSDLVIIHRWDVEIPLGARLSVTLPEMLGGKLNSESQMGIEMAHLGVGAGIGASTGSYWTDKLGRRFVSTNLSRDFLAGRENSYQFATYRRFTGGVTFVVSLCDLTNPRLQHAVTVKLANDRFEAYEIDCPVGELYAFLQAPVAPSQYLARFHGQSRLRLDPVRDGYVRGVAWRERYVIKM